MSASLLASTPAPHTHDARAQSCHLAGSRCSAQAVPRRAGCLAPAREAAAAAQRGQATVLRAAATAAEVDVSSLATKFGIKDHVDIVTGKGGLPKVVLKHSCGSKAEVYLFGATVTSWTQPSGDEVLYVRPDAKFDKSKGISGGIPHCFPQFGPGKTQQHGFARQCDWEIASTAADLQPDERDPEVELVLTDSAYTRKIWPHAFKAIYTVSLHGEELRTDFRVVNTGDQPFEFTAALHSYFEVLDVSKAKVLGLNNLKHLDKTVDVNNPAERFLKTDGLTFEGPWDSIFVNPPEHIELDVGSGAGVSISASGWNNAVVWNPWTAAPDCYQRFVCVENAIITKPVHLKAGDSWRGQQQLAVVDL